MEIQIITFQEEKKKKVKIYSQFDVGDAVELLVHSINDIKELGVVLDMRLNFVTLSFEYYASFPSKTFWCVEHELINYELPVEKQIGFLKKDEEDGV